MINYTEKGASLHIAIAAAGHYLRQENGVWLSDNDTVVQSIIDAFDPLAAAINVRKNDIDSLSKKKRDTIVGNVSSAEMSKWQEKYRQSKAYQTTPADATAPDVATEAAARGVTTAALASKIATKGDAYSTLEANIAGVGGKHADTVSVMTDWKAVLAYDITIGWPV